MAGIGNEILCIMTGGLDCSGYVETDPRRVVAERIARGWISDRGSIWWAPERGVGLLRLQGADLSKGDLARVEIEARADALREDGVQSARVSAAMTNGTVRLVAYVTIDSGLSFSFAVDSSGAVEVLS